MERPFWHGPIPKRVPHRVPKPVRPFQLFRVSHHHLMGCLMPHEAVGSLMLCHHHIPGSGRPLDTPWNTFYGSTPHLHIASLTNRALGSGFSHTSRGRPGDSRRRGGVLGVLPICSTYLCLKRGGASSTGSSESNVSPALGSGANQEHPPWWQSITPTEVLRVVVLVGALTFT